MFVFFVSQDPRLPIYLSIGWFCMHNKNENIRYKKKGKGMKR